MSKDYYDILGVGKDATDDQLKSAYRKLSKKWHPDMQQGKSDAEKKEAEEKFKELNEAYDCLSDIDKRANYDRFGSADSQQGFEGMDPFSGMGSMFRHFGFDFGGMGPQTAERQKPSFGHPENGSDVLVRAEISFKDSCFGVEREFEFNIDKECSHCNGTGVEGGANASVEKCQSCHGTGVIMKTFRSGIMVQMQTTTCPHCHGTGYKFDLCKVCHGTKRVSDKKNVKVKVPAGIASGMKLRVKGCGQCGICGGSNGDMYIEISVKPSQVFVREGNDLHVTVHVPAAIAELGGEVKFPALKKMKKLKIPAGTKSGTMFRAKGEGIKSLDGRMHDIVAIIQIDPLINLNDEQKELLKKLQKTISSTNLPEAQKLCDAAEAFYQE